MSDVIRFLAGMGAAAPLPPAQLAEAIAALDVGDAERRALREGDVEALSGLLGGRDRMWCAVFEPERQPDQQPNRQPDGDEPEPEQEGDKDDAER